MIATLRFVLLLPLVLVVPAVARAQAAAPETPAPAAPPPNPSDVAPPPAPSTVTSPPVAPPPAATTPAAPPPVSVAAQTATMPASPSIPLRLAAQVEVASGVATGSFHNQLVGGRLDGRFSPHVSLGGYLAFANLKGKDGHAHAPLTYAQVEYLAGDPASTVKFPLRFATGYLAENGPVVRAAAGFSFTLGRTVDLVTELAPMVWLTNNQTLLSLNLSVELAFRL